MLPVNSRFQGFAKAMGLRPGHSEAVLPDVGNQTFMTAFFEMLDAQVGPTPLHVLGRISPISSPFFPVFCAFSPSRRGGSNKPQAGTQGQETAGKPPRGVFDSGPQRLWDESTGL